MLLLILYFVYFAITMAGLDSQLGKALEVLGLNAHPYRISSEAVIMVMVLLKIRRLM